MTRVPPLRNSQKAYMKLFHQELEAGLNPSSKTSSVPLKQLEKEAQKLSDHWFWASAPSAFEGVKVLLEHGQFVRPLRLGGSLELSGQVFSVALFQVSHVTIFRFHVT